MRRKHFQMPKKKKRAMHFGKQEWKWVKSGDTMREEEKNEIKTSKQQQTNIDCWAFESAAVRKSDE